MSVSFESAAMRLLPNGQKWIAFFREVYDLYCHSGLAPALSLFRKRIFPPVDNPSRIESPTQNTRASDDYQHQLFVRA
jgi:hypothetical protein